MSGDWIKMRSNLWDDPRVMRICDLTNSTEGPVIGALYWLWASADQHTEDGSMPGLTVRQIDRKTGLQGFAAALQDVGWLAEIDGGLMIERFEEHNGASAKRRCSEAKRKAGSRSSSASCPHDVRTESGHDAPKNGHHAELEIELEIEKKDQEKSEPKGSVSIGKPTDEPAPKESKAAALQERLARVTADAIDAYNASRLVKPNGGLLASVNPKIGAARRQSQVRRCIKVAREICQEGYGGAVIVPEFWRDYWDTCCADPFLSGRGERSAAHSNWMPDFDYLTRESTMLKVFEKAGAE